MKLTGGTAIESHGACDPASLLVLQDESGRLRTLLAQPTDCQPGSVEAVADLEADGEVEILLVLGEGEAYHWEIYRLVGTAIQRVYSGMASGC